MPEKQKITTQPEISLTEEILIEELSERLEMDELTPWIGTCNGGASLCGGITWSPYK